MKHPAVVVVTRRTTRKNKYIDYVGEYHLALLIRMRVFPQMVPVVEGTASLLPQYMQGMKGLLLVEGEDVEAKRYKPPAASLQYLEKTHPLKDEIEIRLIRHALRKRLPILGICRGSQLVNVVCGGTLYVDVQKEKESHVRHIDYHHYDTYRHPVAIVPRTPLAGWYGAQAIRVNSYHHQGIRELAPRFRPMAHAKDGLIEAYYDPKADFLVGMQFHPERMLAEYAGNLLVWKAFGRAVHRTAAR
ncbi:MAG: gamma-glutamyl-gamma-aminobutyrate hydrolase family protein [Candidatus Acidiferrales bacterium]|jgi:gamma-glutamyl-gamma-aminobutyrate hydrolase PuuD